jgi:predicted MFS family arabinose efflux permease
MKASKIKAYFAIAVSLLIIIVLSVTGALNIGSFKQNYAQSLLSSYAVLGGETVKKIEYAVQYGKPLSNFYGMDNLLAFIQNDEADIEQVRVYKSDGTMLYNQDGRVASSQVDPLLWSTSTFPAIIDKKAENYQSYISFINSGKYHLLLPITNNSGEWIGSLELLFDEHIIRSTTDAYMWKMVSLLGLFAFLSVILLIVFINKVSIINEQGEVRKTRMFIFIFILLGVVQISFGAVNYTMLKNGYLQTLKDNTSIILNVVERDVESVIMKGVPYSKLYDVGSYLRRLIESVPEIDRISVIDTGYTSEKLDEEELNSKFMYTVPLMEDKDGHANYRAVVDLSQSYINSKMFEMMLDALTMLVISFLLMVEITLFTFILLGKKLLEQHGGVEAEKAAAIRSDRTIIRPLGFIVFTSLYMSTAFIPVLMKKISQPMFGLSENVIIGLPISAELLFMAAASMIAGYAVDKRGWKPVFTFGCIVLAIGTIGSGLAWEAYGFILSRAIAGFGFGFSLMSMQAFVVTAPSEEGKNNALAALNSGAYAGINCGVVVGAMLADRVGFSFVFFIAFAIIGIGGLYAMISMQNLKMSKEQSSLDNDNTESSTDLPDVLELKTITLTRKEKMELLHLERLKEKRPITGFIGNMNVILYFIFLLIPLSIGSMFLYYFFPLFAEGEGLSPSNIGRAFLLNGLCIVYLGPILTKLASRWISNKTAVFISSSILIGALFLFTSSPTIMTAFVAVILFGIAEGFGLTASINYYIGLKASQWLGEGKAMGYYSLIENFGQMLGPVLFGSLLVLGSSGATGSIGILLAGTLLIFMIMSKREKPANLSVKGIGGEM